GGYGRLLNTGEKPLEKIGNYGSPPTTVEPPRMEKDMVGRAIGNAVLGSSPTPRTSTPILSRTIPVSWISCLRCWMHSTSIPKRNSYGNWTGYHLPEISPWPKL